MIAWNRTSLSRLPLAFALHLLVAPSLNGQATPLGGEFRVNSNLNVNKDWPKIAVAKGGAFQVAWQQPPSSPPSNIFVRRFSAAGANLGNDTLVNGTIGYNSTYPAIASLNSSGAFVVVWRSSYGSVTGNNGVTGKLFDSSGGVSVSDFRVDTYTSSTNFRTPPSVSTDSSGNFVVVWGENRQYSTILGQRYASSGAPLGGNFIVFAGTTFSPPTFLQNPVVSMASDGSFVVAFASVTVGNASNYDLVGQRFNASGAPLGSLFQVNTYTTGAQKDPAIGRDSSGNFVVVWNNQPSMVAGPIAARLYGSSGAPIGNEFQVSGAMSYATLPSVARFPAGDFIVSWTDTTSSDVHARFFSGSSPVGSEFRVNTYTTYNQYKTSVAADSAGNFTVVWVTQQSADSPTVHEIQGQRYCPTLTNVSIALTSGTTNACPGQTAGTLTVTDTGGGSNSHQWGYRTSPAGAITSLGGQTGPTYVINTGNALPAGTSYVVCTTVASCGGTTLVSNNVTAFVGDVTAPVVSPPTTATVTQTLCQ